MFTMDADFAYVIGLITTDGNLSKDGRHLCFVSNDLGQIKNFAKILKLKNKISVKKGSYPNSGNSYFIQFGNVELYRYLTSIGLHPNKSKTIGEVKIPDKYFADFLRGLIDGDGFSYSYWDKRWKSSFMLYLGLVCASKNHLLWLEENLKRLYQVHGSIKKGGRSGFQLVYSKNASLTLINEMYKKSGSIFLKRKKFKIDKALSIISKQAGVLKLVNRHA